MDFNKLVQEHKEDIIKRTIELLSIPSVLDKFDPSSETPFGVEINNALQYMLDLAKEDDVIIIIIDDVHVVQNFGFLNEDV